LAAARARHHHQSRAQLPGTHLAVAPEVRAGVGATEAERGDAQVLTVAAWDPIKAPKKDGFEYQIPLFQ
jgi:hypothetical protein